MLVVTYLLLMEVVHLSGELIFVKCREKAPPILEGLVNRILFSLKISGNVLRLIFS